MVVMARPSKLSGSKRPYNPGLREFVSGKQHWSGPTDIEAAKNGFRAWHERGYLPHRDEPGLTQFVTFHLADTFPASLRSEWQGMLAIEDDLERHRQLEKYLDKGRGECHLRRKEVACVVEDSLLFRHQIEYELHAWVLMPNHVHDLFTTGNTPMSTIVENWKKFTAHQANALLGRQGKFWADDYWDTYMRNGEHTLRTRRYIENNPVKAHLVREPEKWAWSSARFRDKNLNLRLENK